MIAMFKKYSTLISVSILLAALIFVWLFPSARLILVTTILLFSLILAGFAVIRKHREAYLQGKITRGIFVRNVLLEMIGILLAMTLASLLGRYIAQILTDHLNNGLTKLITGALIGLLTGIGVSILVKHTWGRMAKL